MKRTILSVVLSGFMALMICACGPQKTTPHVRSAASHGAIILEAPPFNNIGSLQVTVIGQIASPGFYSYTEIKSLPEVIALAGGPTPEADITNIRVVPMSSYRPVRVINMEQLRQETPPLMPNLANGDTVYIPAKPKE